MKKLSFLGLLLLSGLALVACSTDTPAPTPSPSVPTTPTQPAPAPTRPAQGVTDTEILVGNSAATTGALAFVGVPFNAGINAYFNMVNEQGGINGRRIRFINYDDEFNGALGLTYAERLVEDDKIFSFVGHFGTPTVGATLSYLNEVGIPRVYYATGISALFNERARGGERASFPVQPIFDAEGQVMVARAVGDLGAQRIGIIYTNDDAGNGLFNGIVSQVARAGVGIVVAQVAADATDMSAAAATIRNGNVDVILVAANQVPATVAIKALGSAGNTQPVLISYVNAAPTFLVNVADELKSFDIYSSAWVNLFQEDGVSFTPEYVQFATEVSKIDPAFGANSFAIAGWVAASTFVQGLERVGRDVLTWERFIEAMESAPVNNPLGGSVDFANGRRVGTQSMSMLVGREIVAEDGTLSYEFANFRPFATINEILGN